MDASDLIRKRKAKTIYSIKRDKLIAAQPTKDCNSTSCAKYASCIVNFSSYEEKQLFLAGKNACNSCKCTGKC